MKRPKASSSFAEGVTEAEAALSRLLARVAEARQPFVPTELITRTYYHGRQEDLAEFVLNLLSECAGCHGLLCGQEVPRLHCRHCPYSRPLRAENFHSVQLSILDIHSVQDALNAYLVRATVQEDVGDWCCLSADCLDGGRAQDAPLHVSRVEHWPRVLALTLKRWTRPGEVLRHRVFCNKLLRVDGNIYDLCSLATHVGPRPDSGHCIAYRRDDFGFLKMDDERVSRVQQRDEDYFVTTPTEKVYVLFYIKREINTEARPAKFARLAAAASISLDEDVPAVTDRLDLDEDSDVLAQPDSTSDRKVSRDGTNTLTTFPKKARSTLEKPLRTPTLIETFKVPQPQHPSQ